MRLRFEIKSRIDKALYTTKRPVEGEPNCEQFFPRKSEAFYSVFHKQCEIRMWF